MKRILLAGLLLTQILQSYAQEPQPLFSSGGYTQRLDYAMKLNGDGLHMAAFDSLKSLHQDVSRIIRHHGLTPALVPDTNDFIFYQNILISEAQCAYMVNLLSEMASVCDEHFKAKNERSEKGLGRDEDYCWQIASLHKTRGDYYYIKGARDSRWYDDARKDYHTALELFESANDVLATAKLNAELAQLEYIQGNYKEALDFIKKAAYGAGNRIASGTNAKESFTEAGNSTLNISYRSALAMCQARTYDFRKALSTINGLIAMLPENDRQMPELKRRKAKILLLQNEDNGADIMDANDLYEEYFKSVKESVNDNFIRMTADQREEFWMLQRPFVVDCYMLEGRNPELLYDVTLYNKGMLLQTARSFDDLLYDGTQMGTPDELGTLKELRMQDTRNAIEGNNTTLAADFEKELLHTMSSDGRREKFFGPLNHTWRDVQKALPPDGCAIEFIEYEKRDSMHFGALVLRKTGKPQFVPVCNADELAEYCPGGLSFTLGTLMKSTDGSSKNAIYGDKAIWSSIWNTGMIRAIGDSGKVYFSADGYLHQLAVEYMLPDELQGKSFYRLSSTRALVEGGRADPGKIRNGAAFVLGGIRYDSFANVGSHDLGNDAEAFAALQEKGVSFSYLKGAKQECDSIICCRNNPEDLYLYGTEATEQAFCQNGGNYPILHISTHGFFNGDKAIYNELTASSPKDVLSQSVLALSNAGTHLRDKQFDASYKDGLVSAREIARLNLENVELVTTSACQTGLGYITADGVYGIQRGFKSAGVKGMIMTLWSVNVESARIFFTSLYKYIGEGESVASAFSHSRNDLMSKTAHTTSSIVSTFDGRTLTVKQTPVILTDNYANPQHSCPYLLIDAWE